MESFMKSIYPLINLFRIFGLNLDPTKNNNCCISKQFRMSVAKFFHLSMLISMSYSIFYVSATVRDKFMKIMLVYMSTVFLLQNVGSRLVIGFLFGHYVNMINETNKLFQRFGGQEQKLLKSYKHFIQFLAFYPLYLIFFYLLSCVDSAYKLESMPSEEEVNAVANMIKNISTMLNYFIAIPLGYTWIGIVEAIVLAQLVALLIVFKLSEESGTMDKHLPNIQKLTKFIEFHKRSCKLVQTTNKALNHLVIFWIALQINLALFHSVCFNYLKTVTSLIISVSAVIVLSIQLITAGLVNQMMHKNLRKYRQLVSKFPTKMSTKLAIKLELYSVFVEVNHQCLTAGGIKKLDAKAIISVLGFILTYMAFLKKKQSSDENLLL
ncbi:hypothetical protein CHUAL_009938 [Chamberlinius hualienensis]